MKKSIALILALLMALAMFACQPAAPAAEAPASEAAAAEPAAEPEAAAEPAGDPYEIVVELVNYGMDIPDLGLIEEKVNEIILPKINATIKFLPVAVSEQYMHLSLSVAAGEKIDLAMSGITTNPYNLVGQGVLLPITEYVKASEPLMALAGDYLDACTIGGEIYCYPGIMYPANGVTYMYDVEQAKALGAEIPAHVDTTADLEAVFAAIKEAHPEVYPLSMGDGDCATPQNLYKLFDEMNDTSYHASGVIMMNDPDEKIVNVYAAPEYSEMVHRHRDWYEKGYIYPDSYANDYSVQESLSAALSLGVLNNTSVGSSVAYWSSNTGKTLAGCTVGTPIVTSGGVTNMSWGIPVSCENPEKVIEFLEIMYTDGDVATLLNYGVEGKHYVRVEGTEHIVSYPEGQNAFTCGYGTFINWYGDTLKTYQMTPATDESFAEIVSNTLAGGARLAPSFGYSFDGTAVSTEVAAVTNVITQYRPGLECGVVADVDAYLAEFLKALTDAGIDKIIAENQAQFDAWKAAK